MAGNNPFAPTFGATPPVLAGRDDVLADIEEALDTGPTHPEYTTLFTGIRGAGKTVMLNAVEDLARGRGWLTLSDNATPTGLLDRLGRAATALLSEIEEGDPKRRVKSITAAGFGVEFELTPETEKAQHLRTVLSALGDALNETGAGVMITLDEMHGGDLSEIREFGGVLQHVTRREQRPVAFAGAALALIEDSLLSDTAATFLQRCSRYDVDQLDPAATRTAILGPIEQRGAAIDPEALEVAVAATSGYAYMVQLVGFHSWKAADDPESGITASDVSAGIARAEQRFGQLVLAATWRDLSEVDRRFLIAVARGEGDSHIREIAERLEVSVKYAGVYRRRLIKAGVIEASSRGRIDFAHHATRAWLRSRPEYAEAVFLDD